MKLRFIFILLLLSYTVLAQEPRSDKVLMTNGEVKQGQVIGIDEQSITFVHQGESLQ